MRMFADFMVQDKDGQPVLAIEVKPRVATREDIQRFLGKWRLHGGAIPFGMIVDPGRICVFRADFEDSRSPILELETAPILQQYDPDFPGRNPAIGSLRIFHDYLMGLAEAWLRDLAYHWKSAAPPEMGRMEQIGLLPRLVDGTTYDEEALGGRPAVR